MTSRAQFKIVRMLRPVEIFHDLKPLHLQKLASIATELQFSEGQIIYQVGDVGEALYVIHEGEVAIEMEAPEGGWITVYTVGPGQLFGWSSLFPGRRKAARARAVKPSHAIAINADQLRRLFQVDHELEYVILTRMSGLIADRVKAARLQLVNALAQSKA